MGDELGTETNIGLLLKSSAMCPPMFALIANGDFNTSFVLGVVSLNFSSSFVVVHTIRRADGLSSCGLAQLVATVCYWSPGPFPTIPVFIPFERFVSTAIFTEKIRRNRQRELRIPIPCIGLSN